MNTSYSPQAAADQARSKYRNVTAQLGLLGLDTAIPDGVRALAETTVAQTRQAYDRSLDAFDASVKTFERSFEAAGQGAVAFNRKIVDIVRRNVDVSFDLAAFWRKQFGVLAAQAEEVRALSANPTADMSKPSNRK